MRWFFLAILFVVGVRPMLGQLTVRVNPVQITPYGIGIINVNDLSGKAVKVRYLGVASATNLSDEPRINHPLNFIMLNQTELTTPAAFEFMLNPFRVSEASSLRIVFETVDEQPPRRASNVVSYLSQGNFRPVIQSVVNTFSQQPILSPGALVTIYAPYLSFATLTGQYDNPSRYPTDLMSYSVRINGVAAPLLSVAFDRIHAIVPYEIAGSASAEVVVSVPRNSRFGPGLPDPPGYNDSPPFVVLVQDTSPGIRTVFPTGSGWVDARQIVKEVWSQHGPENPAPRGAAVELFVTGAGLWAKKLNGDIAYGNPHPPPETAIGTPLGFTGPPLSLTIGGAPAQILYSGATFLRPWGLLQVNAIIPDNIGSGPQPVILKIGSNDNAAQRATIQIE